MNRHLERAIACHRGGKLVEAEALYRRTLKEEPRNPDAHHLLGCLRLQEGRSDEAIRLIREATDASPMTALFHESLAEAYHKRGQLENATSECLLALRLNGSLHKPLNLLGLIHLDRCEYEEALALFSKALAAKVPYVEAMINMAATLNRTGDHGLAKNYCELALKLQPKNPLAWTNLGMAYKGLRRLEEAKGAFARAGNFPMARYNLGYTYLLEDNLVLGLPLCEERKRLLGIGREMRTPEWDGEAKPGRRLLVLHEQGMGDTILMGRFYPQLLPLFAGVTVKVQRPLERLIGTLDPALRVVSGDGPVDHDFWCPAMSLPLLLGIDSVEKIPTHPWLHPAVSPIPRNRPRIGVNWAGNPSFAHDRVRSTRLGSLAPLLKIPDVDWISLHKGHLEHEAEERGLPQPLREATDFYDTALVLGGLDLVISTETAIPNLSAAMGIPTCVLTSVHRDWRWRSWFADVTICEQDAPGDWESAVAKARDVVRRIVPAAA
jgi:Flp pilus assembly protein TadD